MCGFAGWHNFDGSPSEGRILKRMIDAQRHRGPDDQGMRLFSHASRKSVAINCGNPHPDGAFEGALGFNRLSILDLSQGGHQPMLNADGSILLACNGEVYNAMDYRKSLQASGFAFRSTTDSEVLLYLYEKHGIDGMLSRINGMFAMVIVDLREGDIHVIRDHLGVKPLYWTTCGSTFLFASEAKSFLYHPSFRAELNVDHLDEYLSFRYVAGEGSLLKGVQQLRPGHRLCVSRNGVTLRRYWEIPDSPARLQVSDDVALEMGQRLLEKAVRSQLISDVPVGCQLSGGIDSSLVSLFAREHFAGAMQTFSIVFRDPEYSEESWISQAATTAGADSHSFLFTDESFFDTLDAASWHLDQPISHPNSLGIWLLAQKARESVTVLLSGEGADELFGGYGRFYFARVRPRIQRWLPLLRFIPGLGRRLERQAGGDATVNFICATLFQRPDLLLRLRPEADFRAVLPRRRAIFSEGNADDFGNCLKYEMQTHLVDLLVRQDKMTMAHSVENRVPFLDLDLVSFARSLPPDLLAADCVPFPSARMRGTKVLLKRIARRTFDARFVYRRKCGFGLPLPRYFADGRFACLMEERLLPGMARRGLVSAEVVRQWWKNLPNMPPGMAETLWVSIAFELWAQQFLDRPQAGTAGGV